MPRTRKTATAPTTEESFSAEPLAAPTSETSAAPDASANGEKRGATPGRKCADLPDTRELMSATLGPSSADPKMHLLRSY